MNPTTFDYYAFREVRIRSKINEELNLYEQGDFADLKDLPPLNQYISYLKTRIGTNTKNKYKNNARPHEHLSMIEYGKDLDILVYQRPWNKLKNIHKIAKIKEYINNMEYDKGTPEQIEKNKTDLIEQLSEGLTSKRFVKGKSVIEYDQGEMIITEISCVSLGKKGLYEIDWDD